MQTIKLKKGFESAINQEILEKITIENEFIYLNEDNLEISYNLDVSDMDDSPFGDDESDFESFIEEFEESLPELKDYFSHDFEIVYFTYNGEYSATMWKYEAGKLMKSSGWIGDFCNNCEDADDEDEARDEFVDANYPNLKQGYPSEELLDGLRAALD
jgi:hypothetical protein